MGRRSSVLCVCVSGAVCAVFLRRVFAQFFCVQFFAQFFCA